MVKCYDCGLKYGCEGWIEAIIPDKIWNEISPTGDEGGILCINCISQRLAKKGHKNIPVWLRGTEPLRVVLDDTRDEEITLFIMRNWHPNLTPTQ